MTAQWTKTVSGWLPNEDGTITMDIYVDRSLVEAFFMNIRRSPFALMWRILLPRQWDCLPATGEVTVESLYVATMGSIFD